MEIIPKQESTNSLRSRLPLIVVIAALCLVLISFFVFRQLQSNSKKTIANLENFLNTGATAKEKQLEQKVLAYQRKIADFGVFIQSRQDSLRFFQFLEQYAHPKIFFTDANLDTQNRLLILQGETLDFGSLDQQLSIFKQRDEIDGVRLSKLDIGTSGRVVFTLELAFSPKIFQ